MGLQEDFQEVKFFELPWQSARFATTERLEASEDDDIKRFIEKIKNEEESGVKSQAMLECLAFLGHKGVKAKRSSSKSGDGMVPLLMYRMLDAALWRRDDPGLVLFQEEYVPRRSKMSQALRTLRANKRMEDWTQLILDAKNMFSGYNYDVTSRRPVPSDDVGTQPDALSDEVLLELFKVISHTNSKISLLSILANFGRAAFFARYLMLGELDFPKTIADLEEQLKCKDDILWKIYKSQYDDLSIHNLKADLYIALALTPILLLLPIRLSEKPPSRFDLVQCWLELKRQRPLVVAQIEQKLFGVIFDAATGKATVFNALRDCIEECVQLLSSASRTAKEWFSAKPTAEPMQPTRPVLPDSVPAQSSSPGQNALPKRDRKAPDRFISSSSGAVPGTHTGIQHKPRASRNSANSKNKTKNTSSTSKANAGTSSSTESDIEYLGSRYQHREIIDLEEYYQTVYVVPSAVNANFNTKRAHSWVSGDTVMLSSSTGAEWDYEPKFHFRATTKWFGRLYSEAQTVFIDGKPDYLSGSLETGTKLYSRADFQSLTRQDQIEAVGNYHILVSDGKGIQREPLFNQELLETVLGTLDRTCTLNNMSIRDPARRMVQGTAWNILEAVRLGGPAINGLDFELPFVNQMPSSYDTSALGWLKSGGLRWCQKSGNYPTSQTNFAVVSTEGCHHPWHLDSDGFGVSFRVLCGTKIIFYAVPMAGADRRSFAAARLYTEGYDAESANRGKYRIGMVVLSPSEEFIMLPNTPHAVVTTEETILQGRHFYCRSSMRDTMYGIMQVFAHGQWLTNASHQKASMHILSRILAWWHLVFAKGVSTVGGIHVPDIYTFEGIEELMCTCVVVELSNVLQGWTEHPRDRNTKARHRVINARRRARELMTIIDEILALKDETGRLLKFKEDVYWPYLAQVGHVLYWCRQTWDDKDAANNSSRHTSSEEEEDDGENGKGTTSSTDRGDELDVEELLAALVRCFDGHGSVLNTFRNLIKSPPDEPTFSYVGPTFTVTGKPGGPPNFTDTGLTQDDLLHGVSKRDVVSDEDDVEEDTQEQERRNHAGKRKSMDSTGKSLIRYL